MPILAIESLTIRFRGQPVVRELSLTIDAGEVLGLVGESGSGKSVTSLAVLGLLDGAEVSGAIRFDGVDLMQQPREALRSYRGKRIAMIFQEPMTALNPVMSIGRQVAEAVEVHQPQLKSKQVREAVLAALDAVALPNASKRYDDYPHQFSGGQRQRILIAMAIVNRPELLIADEPTTALDVTVQAQILELLGKLREEHRLAMLFISHDLAVVGEVADRVAVMRNGLLLEEGPVAAIFGSPRHPYTKSLLGAVPTLATDRDNPLATLPRSTALDAGVLREVGTGHLVRIAE